MAKVNMQAAVRILLIVTATFINTECFRTFEKRQESSSSVDESRCSYKFMNCAHDLYIMTYIDSHQNFGTILAPHIDQICSDYSTNRHCMEQAPKSCLHLQGDFHSTYPIMDFVCSDRGKSLLREFQQSVCYNNFPNVWNYWSDCTSDSSDNNSGFSYVKIGCVVNKFKAECGEAGGILFSSILDLERK